MPHPRSLDPFGIVRPLNSFRRKMRNYPTPAEAAILTHLRNRYGVNGIGRQIVIGWYIVDFLVMNKGVIVEMDGSSHDGRESHDQRRDRWIESFGFTILRFENKMAFATPGRIISEVDRFPDIGAKAVGEQLTASRTQKKKEQRAALARKGMHYNSKGRLVPIVAEPVAPAPVPESSSVPRAKRPPRPPCPRCGRILARRWTVCRCGAPIEGRS